MGGKEWESEAVSPMGSRTNPLVGVWGLRPQKLTTLFVKKYVIFNFEPVLTCMHDYINQFIMK